MSCHIWALKRCARLENDVNLATIHFYKSNDKLTFSMSAREDDLDTFISSTRSFELCKQHDISVKSWA